MTHGSAMALIGTWGKTLASANWSSLCSGDQTGTFLSLLWFFLRPNMFFILLQRQGSDTYCWLALFGFFNYNDTFPFTLHKYHRETLCQKSYCCLCTNIAFFLHTGIHTIFLQLLWKRTTSLLVPSALWFPNGENYCWVISVATPSQIHSKMSS